MGLAAVVFVAATAAALMFIFGLMVFLVLFVSDVENRTVSVSDSIGYC